MSFVVAADAYDQFMGRWSQPLAAHFAELVDVRPGQRVLDVGCGPGALTTELVARAGAATVSAVDPSEPFVAALRSRLPAVDVQQASAESLPFADDTFDLTLAQLVVHFMADPVRGLAELARVTRPGGTVAACVWDHGGGQGPLAAFWAAVTSIDPNAVDESNLAGARSGHLAELFVLAGLTDVEPTSLTVTIGFADFAEWWQPFTLGVGPAGAYVAALDSDQLNRLRDRCTELLPDGPFELTALAWTALGRA